MLSHKKIEQWMGTLLILGILFSATLVIIGGTLFLLQNGQETMPALPPPIAYQLTLSQVWQFALSFTPLGIIQLGLLALVSVQILRVAMLCVFYVITRDYWFIAFSTFILLVLVYCIVWRN